MDMKLSQRVGLMPSDRDQGLNPVEVQRSAAYSGSTSSLLWPHTGSLRGVWSVEPVTTANTDVSRSWSLKTGEKSQRSRDEMFRGCKLVYTADFILCRTWMVFQVWTSRPKHKCLKPAFFLVASRWRLHRQQKELDLYVSLWENNPSVFQCVYGLNHKNKI